MSKKLAALLTVVFLILVYAFLLVLLPKMAEDAECDSNSFTDNVTNVSGNISAFYNVGEPIISPPPTISMMPKVYLILPGLIGGAILIMIWLNPPKKMKE